MLTHLPVWGRRVRGGRAGSSAGDSTHSSPSVPAPGSATRQSGPETVTMRYHKIGHGVWFMYPIICRIELNGLPTRFVVPTTCHELYWCPYSYRMVWTGCYGSFALAIPKQRPVQGLATVMAHFHQRRLTRIRIPSPIVTLYYAQLFPLVWIQIQIPVWIVSRMVTVPILGMDLCPTHLNLNPSPLVEMSHNIETAELCPNVHTGSRQDSLFTIVLISWLTLAISGTGIGTRTEI